MTHDELFALADALWVQPIHECRMAAVELLVLKPALIGLDDLRSLLRRDQQLDRFFAYAEQLLPEREFFIRKVIGWVAREVAARHAQLVSQWLRDNMAAMNLITLREPLRRLPDAVELRVLYDTRRNSAG